MPALFWRPICVALSGSISFLLTTSQWLPSSTLLFPWWWVPRLPPVLCFCLQQDGGHSVLLHEIFFSWVCVPTLPVLGHRLCAFFTSISSIKLLSKTGGPFISLPISPHPYQHLVLSDFLIFANLLYVKWYLIFLLCFSYYLWNCLTSKTC